MDEALEAQRGDIIYLEDEVQFYEKLFKMYTELDEATTVIFEEFNWNDWDIKNTISDMLERTDEEVYLSQQQLNEVINMTQADIMEVYGGRTQ